MDPLTLGIGAGISGLSSLIGGAMNSSSAAAINTANINANLNMANNAVSMRVADANRAGINPLAALGVATPSSAVSSPTNPGAGIMAAGRDIGAMIPKVKDPHQETMEGLAERRAKMDIEQLSLQNTNAQLEMRRLFHVLEKLGMPGYMPDGVQRDTITAPTGGLIGETADWFGKAATDAFGNPRDWLPNMGALGTPSWMNPREFDRYTK